MSSFFPLLLTPALVCSPLLARSRQRRRHNLCISPEPAVFPLERHELYGHAHFFLSVCSSFILTPCGVPRVNRDPSSPRVRLPLPNALRLSRGRRVTSLRCAASVLPTRSPCSGPTPVPPRLPPAPIWYRKYAGPLQAAEIVPAYPFRGPVCPAPVAHRQTLSARAQRDSHSLPNGTEKCRASSRASSLRRPHCAYSASATLSASASASAAAAAASAFQPSASDRGKAPASARAWFFENESTSHSSVDAENAGGTECGRRRQPHPPARPLAPPACNSVLRTYGVSRDRDAGRGGAAHGHDKAPRSRAALIAWRATTRDGPASIISACCTSSMICETPRDGGASDKVNKPYEYQAEMGKDDRGVLRRGAGEVGALASQRMRPGPTAAGESEAAFYILDRIKVNRGIPNPKSIGAKLLRRERANVASSAD
ncbi:hypothetical protein DFH09DRAFT_1069513 [Mycena vulgaris]|nr:hypothetical protein DFH09DRAFT_1069513 [Mycena vulgaris]